MQKRTLSWPLAGAGFALMLSGCNLPGQTQSPKSDEGAVSNAVAPATEPSVSTQAPAAPATRMQVTPSAGAMTVTLNGRTVGDYPSSIQVDVKPYVVPGKNIIQVSWEANSAGNVDVQYALDAAPDKYNDITRFNLTSSQGRLAGTRTIKFNLPNPDGTLPAPEVPLASAAPSSDAPANNAPAGDAPSGESSTGNAVAVEEPTASAPATDTPPSPPSMAGEPSTRPSDIEIPAPRTAPSSGVKAIMSVSANDAPISVTLNGQSVGDFQSYLKLDVGRYLKPGTNTAVIKWTGKTYFDVKIAYFSTAANDYRDVSRTQLYQQATRQPGSRKVTFQIPSS